LHRTRSHVLLPFTGKVALKATEGVSLNRRAVPRPIEDTA
jgi:hypothetical protein